MKYPLQYRVYFPVVSLLCCAACVLRTIACLTSLTPDGYFKGTVLPDISVWILLAMALFAATYPLFNPAPNVRPMVFSHPVQILPVGLLAMSQLFLSIDLLQNISRGDTLARILATGTALLGIAGAVYYALCLCMKHDDSALRAWFGIAAILFCAFYAVYLYFETSTPHNTDCKMTSQITYLSMSLFLLTDVRLSLGKARYRLQVIFGFWTAALTAYAAFPALIARIFGSTNAVIDRSLFETVFTLLFFFFVCARLYALTRLPKDELSPFAAAAQADTTSLFHKEDAADNAQENAPDTEPIETQTPVLSNTEPPLSPISDDIAMPTKSDSLSDQTPFSTAE